ncbi:outer membrane protein transport protein, partial [Pseudomonas sp. Kh14]
LERTTSPSTPVLNETKVVNIDASGVGVGFNVGTVFELNEDNRFGLAYHYSPTVTADGTVEYLADPNASSIDLKLPSMVE